MGYIARGLYRELLDEAWVEGSIPNDMVALAEICDCPVEVMTECWARIVPCWELNDDGRWINDKLDAQRTERDALRVSKVQAGRIGGLVRTINKLESEHANPKDIKRVKEAESEARDSLAGAQQQLADARFLEADACAVQADARNDQADARTTFSAASRCHIVEQEKSKRKEIPSGETTPVDDRHTPFKLAIFSAWPTGEPSWNGREGSALGKLLAANPKLTLEGFTRLLKHRRDSEAVNLTARPCTWLERVTDYGMGPLDRYGKPLVSPSAITRGLKFANPQEYVR
jgi:hypothetical protein